MKSFFKSLFNFVNSLPLRLIFAAMGMTGVGFVISGVVLVHLTRIKVCYYCNFQRFMYLTIGFIAFVGVVLPRLSKLWNILISLVALGGAATAIYQSWLQLNPNPSMECGIGDPTLLESFVNWLSTLWPSVFMVTGFCSDIDWVFMGFTLANWSSLFFLSFFAAQLYLLFCYPQHKS